MEPFGSSILNPGNFHQLLDGGTLILDILIEGVPIGHIPSVGKPHHENGQARLAEKHILNQFRIGLDIAFLRHLSPAGPKGIPVDEKVPIGRLVPVFQDVLKLRAEHRGMVQNKVQLQVNAQFFQLFQILTAGIFIT